MEDNMSFWIHGGKHKTGTFNGVSYDNIELHCTMRHLEVQEEFGHGVGFKFKLKTDKVLSALCIDSVDKLNSIRYPVAVKLHYNLNSDGTISIDSFTALK